MFEFIEQNIVYFLFAVLIAVGSVLFFIIKRNMADQQNRYIKTVFSRGDYSKYRKAGDKVLNNTTISFCNNQPTSSVDTLYFNTIYVGINFLKEESFSIAKVGEI